jgi:hypothetical protein
VSNQRAGELLAMLRTAIAKPINGVQPNLTTAER